MKVHVISALFGAYDTKLSLLEIENIYPEYFEFHMYTDQKRLTSDSWNVHVVPRPVEWDMARSAYWYKWNHHKITDAEITVWVDASATYLRLDELKKWCETFIATKNWLSIEEHPSRAHSLMEEMNANCHFNKDHVDVMKRQVLGYYAEGYKDDITKFKLPETGFSIRRPHNKTCISVCEKLWEEMNSPELTKRDQLVYNYAMWKQNPSGDGIQYFTIQEKQTVVWFQDHAHRAAHKEKVALIGPWIGEDTLEGEWIQYVEQVLSKMPIDRVVIGCKDGHERLYDHLSPDKIVAVPSKGQLYNHLVDGKPPTFSVKNNDSVEMIRISPTTEIMRNIHKQDIVLLWCTVRPVTMISTLQEWLAKAKRPELISLRVGVDTKEQKLVLVEGGVPEEAVTIVDANPSGKRGVAWPSYCLSSVVECDDNGDIIIFASDDFFPEQDWDEKIRDVMIDRDCCLVVNDKYSVANSDIVSIPIMSYGTLLSNNKIIYHPEYVHCFSDNELMNVMTEMRRVHIDHNITIEHRHYGVEKRAPDEHDIAVHTAYHSDRDTFKRRCMYTLEQKREVIISTKKLSILTCTMIGRENFLAELTANLEPQVREFSDKVEWCIYSDDGTMDLGAKRNALIDNALGEYIIFVDDDDLVHARYVALILNALKENVDCCSLNGVMSVDGVGAAPFKHSIKYTGWYETTENGQTVYYRTPNHLNAVRRSIAAVVRFSETKNFGEDKNFSDRIKPYLLSEAAIEDVLYHFRFRNVPKEYAK